MAPIRSVLTRIEVDSIVDALPLYEQLAGESTVRRFAFGTLELAWVGPFLLLAGPAESLAKVRRVATLITDDMRDSLQMVLATGGTVLEGPAAGPNGQRLIVRHGDGNVFEYIEAV